MIHFFNYCYLKFLYSANFFLKRRREPKRQMFQYGCLKVHVIFRLAAAQPWTTASYESSHFYE
jgi:hypothetical protein